MNKAREIVKALFRRVSLHENYQTVFLSPAGEEVLDHICKEGYVFESTANSDPHQMAINEGKRMMALAILRHVYRDHGELQKRVEKQIERLNENPT